MNVKSFIEHNLLNKNGRIESQRLTEKWFTKNNFIDELEYFNGKKILDVEKLYCFINNVNNLCGCGNAKRFIGFQKGYTEYCEQCGRTKNNLMKRQGNTDVSLESVADFVKDKNGGYSTTKIKKLSENTINTIKERTKYLNTNTPLSERIYHIEHNLFGLPKCQLCNKPHNNFYSSKEGYTKYCKGKCSKSYNIDNRTSALKLYFYNKYLEKFQCNDEYNITMFSLEEYLNDGDCNIKFKHLKCGHVYEYNKDYQGHVKCPKCYAIRSKIQYDIFDYLKRKIDCKFNDRQLIKPKELDILCNNFAIEYDSLMFHSFGLSDLNMFNNVIENKSCHVQKTELCEEKGVQLFRIFSNEWLDNNKQNIWKSVINSKIGNTNRIYARKCVIKELSSNESNLFLNENHLQGSCNSKINLGLFHENELVSLMTFGKSRYDKNIEYELIRFCSKLNTTVVGAGSKLLKYFERTYKPKSIISYANRRWSQGNLYETLGFEFIKNTPPNYFYFKGSDSSELLSRVQFQKHKLQNKLEVFDQNLTESENMYNNGYRKIYDCGNKKYVKIY